jgi:deoxyribodipyrimidine photo-lyase
VGPVAERLAAIEPDLAARGVRLARLRRSFDTRAWPRAMGGYFAFREGIPDFVEAEGLMPRTPDLFEA